MNLKFKDRDKDLISKYETIALCSTRCVIINIQAPSFTRVNSLRFLFSKPRRSLQKVLRTYEFIYVYLPLVATKKNTENLRDIEKHQEPRLYYYSETPISRVLFIPKSIYNFKSSMSIFLFVWEVNIRQGGMA